MKITWTETHTTEIDDAWINEVFSENSPEDARDIIENNMCEIMYDVKRANIFQYVNNWDEIINSIVNNQGRK